MARPTVLLTRPQPQADRFAAQLCDALGSDISVLISPLLKIEPVITLPDIFSYDGLIVTSESAATCLPPTDPQGFFPVYCVGDRTANVAQGRGFSAISASGSSEDLIALVTLCDPGGRMIHLHGEHTRGNIAENLRERGVQVDSSVAYHQTAISLSAKALAMLQGDGPVIAPLFSPRTAALFADQNTGWHGLSIAALSPAVLRSAQSLPTVDTQVADAPSGSAMIRAIRALIARANLA